MVHQLEDKFTVVVTGTNEQYCGFTCPYLRRFNAICLLYNKNLEHTSSKIIRAQRCVKKSKKQESKQTELIINNTGA